MRTAVVAIGGVVGVVALTRLARRLAVVDRVPRRVTRKSRLPAPIEHRIAVALDRAAIELSVEHACQVWAGAIAASTLLALGLGGSPIAAFGGALGAFLAIPIAIGTMRHRQARRITAAVPPTIERVASELRAGGTIATAVAGIGASDGVLANDFARVETRVALGASLVDALRAWAHERDADGVDVAAGALAMCATVGGPGADALDGLATSLRDRLGVAAEARALSAQARLSAIVVGGTPLLYIAWSAVADRGALDALTATTAGRLCLLVGLALEVLGAWWMHRILVNGSAL